MNIGKLGFCAKEGHILEQATESGIFRLEKTPFRDSYDSLPAPVEISGPTIVRQLSGIDLCFLEAAHQCDWLKVIRYVQLKVKPDVRDTVHVSPDQWDFFYGCVQDALQGADSFARKQRIIEFALEKAVAGSHETFILQMLSEQKLSMCTLQNIARRVAQEPTKLGLILLRESHHLDFKNNLWNHAIEQRHWRLLQEHVGYLLMSRELDHLDEWINVSQINKCKQKIHKDICTEKGPHRRHKWPHCSIYEGVVLYCFQDISSKLYKLNSLKLKAWEGRKLQGNLKTLIENCENKEFLLDFFHRSLDKTSHHEALYSFLLENLPLSLVDASYKTSCDIVLKNTEGVIKPLHRLKKAAKEWLLDLLYDPTALTALVNTLFVKEDGGEILLALIALKTDKHNVVKFLWVCLKMLLQYRSSWTKFVPFVNEALKHFPMSGESSLPVILSNLSSSAYVNQSGDEDTSSKENSDLFTSDSPWPSHDLTGFKWSQGDQKLVMFCAPALVTWCQERNYANVVFFLSFLMKHALCILNWKGLAETTEVVCDSLLFEGVNYATLDGDTAAAASMLLRCKWDAETVQAGVKVLQPLFLKEYDKRLSSLLTACRYRRAFKWYSLLRYMQLMRDNQWGKVKDFLLRIVPLDPLLFAEVCKSAVEDDRWDVFVSVAKNRCVAMLPHVHKLDFTMTSLLTKALDKGYIQGAAAALRLLHLYNIPSIQPHLLLNKALMSPEPFKMTNLFIAAGASVVHRYAQDLRSHQRVDFHAMLIALDLQDSELVALLHLSGAYTSTSLHALCASLTLSNWKVNYHPVTRECQQYLESAASKPLPLERLAGFAVSKFIGVHPGRQQRIERLFRPCRTYCPQQVKRAMCCYDY